MSTVVETKFGKIEGYQNKAGLYIFKGVPFAASPKRFQAAEDPTPWEGVLETKEHKCICSQIMPLDGEPQSEDCLYLNIYTKDTTGKKPVLFFVHGGAFIGGAGSQSFYYGDAFANNDIVYVSINYRLGAVGMFDFSFLDEKFISNIALRDQVFALKWVSENIANFGGDPDDVTIMGQSAGAISILGLLNVPSARQYYKAAIAASSFSDIFQSREHCLEGSKKFLEFAGINSKEELVAISAKELSKKAGKFMLAQDRIWGLQYMMPAYGDDFFPERPLANVKNAGDLAPLLMGVTQDEVEVLFTLGITKKVANKEVNRIMNLSDNYKEAIAKYYGTKKKAIAKLGRDFFIKAPSERYAELYSKKANVWFYRFCYAPPVLKATGLNAVHAIDVPFLFNNFDGLVGKLLPAFTKHKPVFELGDRLNSAVCEFVKTKSCDWTKYSEDYAVKAFATTGDIVENGREDSWQLWNEIYN